MNLLCHNLSCHLSGNSNITKGSIKIESHDNSIHIPKDDIIYLRHTVKSPIPASFSINLPVILANNITFSGYGLTGTLGGKLTISKKFSSQSVFNGTITLNNAIFSNESATLKLSTAQAVYFYNKITNPSLSVLASKKIQLIPTDKTSTQIRSVLITISISGNLNHPIITLNSVPANLSQADMLSYLLFNQPASLSSLTSYNTLLTIIKNNNQASSNFIDKLRAKLGLYQLGIVSGDNIDSYGNITPGTNQLVVGANIFSPKLNIKYARPLTSDNINALYLSYSLGRRWSIVSSQALQGTDSLSRSIDLFYNIERD